MTKSAVDKLHLFEREVFLKSRHIRCGAGVGAIGALSGLLVTLGEEDIVNETPELAQIYSELTVQLSLVSAAIQENATNAAISAYAELVSAIPHIHTVAAKYAPTVGRGHDKTQMSSLIEASERALTILGF